MSHWTYINGIVVVSPPGVTQHQKRYVLETVLDHLPVVSGSERDMNVHVIQHAHYNGWSSHNEFGEPMLRGFRPGGRDSMDTQDEYTLVLEGCFRDREFEQTMREFTKWMYRLAKRVWVKDVLVRVCCYEKEYIFRDARPFDAMTEPFSWNKESGGEPAWTEYLFWDRAKNSDYPMKLYYKYFADPENDAETERRMAYDCGERR